MAFVPGSFRPHGSVIFTTSQNWTVPSGVHKIKILAIGAGGGGGGGYSSTYVGGGGSGGAINYVETFVTPNTTLQIIIGAGGSPGTGGASPTDGNPGGNTQVNIPNPITGDYEAAAWAGGGGGGGAATASANGSGGGGAPPPGYFPHPILFTAALGGQGANGQSGGGTPIFSPSFGNSGINYWVPDSLINANPSPGRGGDGGGVNSNGNPGMNGLVIIWWGDD